MQWICNSMDIPMLIEHVSQHYFILSVYKMIIHYFGKIILSVGLKYVQVNTYICYMFVCKAFAFEE